MHMRLSISVPICSIENFIFSSISNIAYSPISKPRHPCLKSGDKFHVSLFYPTTIQSIFISRFMYYIFFWGSFLFLFSLWPLTNLSGPCISPGHQTSIYLMDPAAWPAHPQCYVFDAFRLGGQGCDLTFRFQQVPELMSPAAAEGAVAMTVMII